MLLEFSDDAVFTLTDLIHYMRGYSARLDWFDGTDCVQSQDIVIEDLRWDECQLFLDYYDYDDESGGPIHPIRTIDLWNPDNADVRIHIY